MANWEWVVDILQTVLGDGRITTKCTCQIVLLIYKGNGEFWGVVFVEVLCKEFLGVINSRIWVVLQFNDFLHGFWTGRGMVTTSLESKFLQKLA